MSGDSKQRRILLSLFVAAAATCTGGLSAAATPPGRIAIAPSRPGQPVRPQIDRSKADVSTTLERRLEHGKADFAIEFSEHADLSAATGMSWNERGRYVYQRLRETAERSQSGMRQMLRARGVAFEPFWIKNTILVRQGDLNALAAASRIDGVARIRELPTVKLVEPKRVQDAARSTTEASDGIAENIRHIGAPQAWAEQSVSGNGVTVGIIDNGVHYTHAAIVKQYRGYHGGLFDHDYNWFNPFSHAAEPVTNANPHGTHVTGTIIGDDHNTDTARRNRIGVAPGAQWMSCLGIGIDDSSYSLLQCGQFMLAPTRTDGTDANPDLRPQVVNNSWSEGTCNGTTTPFYANVLESWIAAGIFPVFAAGNTFNCDLPEPHLSTVSSPAALASAFAVGSTGNHDGEYASHSLWGPTTDSSPGLPHYPDPRGFPRLKPQVVAPGVDIRSATDDDDHGYITMTGTSMSSPHITGLVALMLEAGECLRGDYATLGTIIMQTAKPIPYETGGDPAPGPGNVPNYATGWGEIDAAAAVTAASNACGPQGFVAGKVTAAGGAAVPGAKVEVFADSGAKIYQAITETDGSFKRRVPQLLSGGYTLRVSAFGYLPSSEAGVLVSNGAITRHDTQLATAPVHKVSGRITDAVTGWPLHAKVNIGGYPNGPLWSDPVTGIYSARLPEGTPYRIDVSSDVPGYIAASRDLPVLGDGTQDFALNADTTTCEAPGYRYAQTLLSEDFEQTTSAPPAGWSRSSAGLGWLFGTNADLSSPIFAIPEHGRFAAANDELGAGDGWDNDGRNDMLTMPTLNLAGLTRPVLRYASYVYKQSPRATVEASTDGGATWTSLGTPQTTSDVDGRWLPTALSLTSVATGNVRLRFHSDDGTTEKQGMLSSGWALDDVKVVANCTAPTQGGLVVGHVRDANSGTPLNGAVVSANGLEVTTFGSADPGVGDGFFALYAASGSPLLQAKRGSLPAGYGDASVTPSVNAGATTRTDLALPAGRLRLYPAGPTGSVVLGSTATVPFTVTNSGTQSLNFGFEQAALEEHFDEGNPFPPTGWSRQNGAGDCAWRALDPYMQANYAGGDGSAAMVELYGCTGGVRVDSSLITPPLDLSSSHTASMGFFLSLFNGADSLPHFDVDVSRDGGAWTTVFTRTDNVDPSGPGRLIELDLSAFVGSANVRARFRFQGTPPYGNVIVDQVHLFNGVSMSSMLKLAPETGALAAGESRTLDATFDARAIAQPGTYTLPVRVAEDTPYDWPFGDVEATMTVTAPASYGSIGGAVQSLGYCDAHPSPLGGVTVTITPASGAAVTTTTAEDGSYRYWVEAARGPFTVSVAAPEHVAASRSVAVTAGNAADGAFGLRSLKPCLLSDPAAPSASVPSGQSLQQPFSLLNAGAAGADWTLRAGGDPSVSSRVPLRQTTSPAPAADSGIGCFAVGTTFSFDNRYMRVFPLAERGLPDRSVLVTGLSFAIDQAVGVQGAQPIDLRVHALSGDLLAENLQLLREKTVTVSDASVQRMSVVFDQPLNVRGDTVLVAEIHVPGNGRDVTFTAGGNQLGETAPAYLMAPQCGIHEPTRYADIDPRAGKFNLILEIDTQAPDPCGENATAVDWLGVSQASGHIDADSGVPLKALFNAGGRADGSYQGSMCITPGNTAAPIVVPVTMHVGAGGDAIFRNGFD